MKKSETKIVISLIFVLLPLCSAILTGYEQSTSLTDDRKYGCVWQGGTYPGVICTCTNEAEEMYITPNSINPYSTSSINISNCKKVRFGPNSIADMRNLRNIHLENIGSLHLEESSLIWYGSTHKNEYEERYDQSIPSLTIKIENSNITQISGNTFKGRLNNIHFENVVIENIEPFAFNTISLLQSIVWRNVDLKNAIQQSFKKFSTENLEFNQVRAHTIPSRFLNNITVYNMFKITRCIFEIIRPGSFIVINPSKFEVTETRVNQFDGEGFKVRTRGDVLFKNNAFYIVNDGAFRGISLNQEETVEATITFDSNTFSSLTRESLSTDSSFSVKFTNLNINETCDCTSIDHKIKDVEFYAEIKCLFNDEFVTVEQFKSHMCSIIQSYSTVIVIVGVVLTLAIIIATVLVVYYRKVHLSKKYGSEKNSKKGNMSLIVPDGRTYRETELHVIVERADLLTTDL